MLLRMTKDRREIIDRKAIADCADPPHSPPQPTDQDRNNARIRREIAERQAREYAQVLEWATAAFGPGWLPRCRHFLVEVEEEERVRYTGERAKAAATVYTVSNEAGQDRHFTIKDGKVMEHASYQEGFGAMLLEPHPSRGFEHRGQWCRIQRYSLCWAPYELYEPKTAEQLAKLRASRERHRQEREDKRWADENPLLAWSERANQHDTPAEEESRGR